MTCYNPENYKPYYPPTRVKGIPVVFETVQIPASLGDSKTYPPKLGLYVNKIVRYEADNTVWLYDSLGNYTEISSGGTASVESVNGKTGVVVLTTSDIENDSGYVTATFVEDAISEEATVREGEDERIEGKVDAVADDLADEVSARQDADTALGDRIDDETEARQNADNGLQSQIDAITASSDVTDIVGTYADLQAYDTSTLGDNDIIKVLQDEMHDDETTYYRWNATTQTFTLIGEEGPYYTKAAADAKFQGKLTAGSNITIDANNEISATDTTYSAGAGLDLTGTEFSVDTTVIQEKLAAGSNVTISGNTISATDTTYSDFTGTDGVDPGTSGLVPAPAATDDGKFLKSDGTWDTAGSAINVVQTTGTSTTDVMSQVAASQMIYPSGYETTKDYIKIPLGNATSGGRIAIGSDRIPGNSSISIGKNAGVDYNDRTISIGVNANSSNTSASGTAVGYASASGAIYSVALGAEASVSNATGRNYGVALGAKSSTNRAYEVSVGRNFGVSSDFTRYVANVTDPQLAQDAATKNYVDTNAVGTTESYTIADTDWTALSASSPYTYSTDVTATTTIGNDTIVELLNDQAVNFATYGFAIGAVSGQTVTIYSIGAPSSSITLKVNYKG